MLSTQNWALLLKNHTFQRGALGSKWRPSSPFRNEWTHIGKAPAYTIQAAIRPLSVSYNSKNSSRHQIFLMSTRMATCTRNKIAKEKWR